MNTNNNPASLWRSFKHVLKETIEQLSDHEFDRLRSVSERKYFFNENVFPTVAQQMKMIYKPEWLRVDYTFFKKGNHGWNVPVICIESENNWDACYEETTKLCSINAPLKILITYGFPETRKEELKKEHHNDLYIIEDFKNATQLTGWYILLIYDDTKSSPCFHVYAYDEQGMLLANELNSIEINRQLA